ncbi:alpha-D-ribose 1-methylphosphonate 5-triphosphate diphosphatase [Rhodovarius lipocyclicus]|uniref:alpha-D-ribose 1-methylphosphonate 5-triphosphate diphosphatase n=1 Tax=Rhodovarius lipocyclicus TaxID=268410 RepID=UPI0013587B9F|nr:alpha-D-ribose 1-methylphosphonate 5-triphosphate diphosphatase [Rhodovarius lipocyclicus]
MTQETILTNARVILPDAVIHGTVLIRDGLIAEVAEGRSHAASAQDCEGDDIFPGVVDVHTDNLERQVQPRANARWPSRSAFIAHDAQCAAAGVTTVLDALCLGDLGFDQGRDQTFKEGVLDLTEMHATGLMRAEHLLHLRCELPADDLPGLLDPVADHPLVAMVSVMDHSPGIGQYRDLPRYITMRAKQTSWSVEKVQAQVDYLLEKRSRILETHRRWVLDRVAKRDLPIASHDDEFPDQIARNAADGIRISEFPVTMAAALAAKELGVATILGAPNIVRGGSHSGNVSAMEIAKAGALDTIASDYVPAALIEAAYACADCMGLPEAIATVTANPARMAKLHDRGRVQAGLRADLVQVKHHVGLPFVRRVWRQGARVV